MRVVRSVTVCHCLQQLFKICCILSTWNAFSGLKFSVLKLPYFTNCLYFTSITHNWFWWALLCDTFLCRWMFSYTSPSIMFSEWVCEFLLREFWISRSTYLSTFQWEEVRCSIKYVFLCEICARIMRLDMWAALAHFATPL